ncbi:uncharacterized protein F4822DRAFT_423507 [Hypoxylon trugodes]|uniref:uncharacterized protein n=1 Tax=Hypoxylon trugodes TaxID=326681 RepID=UPI00219E6636|nr:uncharacterized protein F4822DRAFT_423507 [Hypoxylon trugodes]KAI1382549.1 hypothetical protein F4822DRAFT_423507 [Hypoxylon trugodes]
MPNTMRLACIDRQGNANELSAMLQQQPYDARDLVADAVFQCQRSLSDYLDYLQTESAVRNAMIHFQGEQEKYARAYVLSRTLDHRTQKTARADLIYLAFYHGGPLALVGIFYATIDAHRNPRSREVLDYLLNTASDETKLRLIARVGTFPCNPSIGTWLLKLLEKLEPSVQQFACILRCLSTSEVPKELFYRARAPSLTWGADGEATGTNLPVILPVTEESKFANAVARLEHIGFVHVSEHALGLNARIAELLHGHLEQAIFVAEAFKVVTHGFPKYPELESNSYLEQCETFLPILQNASAYLINMQAATLVDNASVTQLVEAYLSASNFGDKPWKQKAIAIATKAAQNLADSPSKTLFAAVLRVRQDSLAHLYQDASQGQGPIIFPIVDHRSNGLSAQLAILEARKCISFNALASASEYLAKYQPSLYGPPSSLEMMQNKQVTLMRSRILRLEGRFQDAYDLLQQALDDGNQTVSLLGTLLCELGRHDEAIQKLNQQIAKNSRRGMFAVKIALGNAYLFRCMRYVSRKEPLDWQTLLSARDIFQGLCIPPTDPVTYYGKMNRLSALFGLALVDHLNGRLDSALSAWHDTLVASHQYLPTGYTDMIISYSTSELEGRRGANAQSTILEGQARTLFSRTGRQHHFAGLGSTWPDIIGEWLLAQGRSPVVPIQEHR